MSGRNGAAIETVDLSGAVEFGLRSRAYNHVAQDSEQRSMRDISYALIFSLLNMSATNALMMP